MTKNTNSNNQIYFPIVGGAKSSSNYGFRIHPITGVKSEHNGIDYKAPIGTPVVAIKSGTITRIGWQSDDNHSKGFGQRISIKYDDGSVYEGFYGHLSGFADGLKAKFDSGQAVKVNAGQVIGYVGSTGASTGPHLHYEESKFVGSKKVGHRDPSLELSKATILNKDGTYSNNISKPTLSLNTENTSSQQAIDLLLGKNQATDPNQTKIIDLSDYDKVTINNTETNSYEVKSGDSFNQIADKLIAEGKISSRQDLIDANPDIIDLDIINVGDVINIPLYETKMTFSIAPKASLDNKAFENLTDPSKASLTVSYFDKDGNPLSQDDIDQMILTAQDSNNNDILLLKQNSVFTTLKDGTIATLESVIEMAQTAKEATVKFVDGYMREVKDLFTTGDGMASLISDVSAGIEKGLAPEQIAKIVATKLVVKTAMSEIRNSFLLSDSDLALLNQGKKISELSTEGQRALSNFATNHPIYNTAYLAAISFATTLLLNMNEGWDSHEYTMVAVESTAQAATQTAIAIATSKGWLSMSSSVGAGVGGAAAYIISAAVKDMFADDHMNSHQWQSTVVSAGIIGAAAWAGCAMAIALIGGAFAGPIGSVVASIIVSQFMGGKEFKEGEYPDPYDFIKIVPKEDGTGNNIYVIEAGALLKAVEGKNDDLFGTNSSDIAIGASGNNTIIGYDGNDHIEGRGGNDVLIGGGNGDDALAIEFRGYC